MTVFKEKKPEERWTDVLGLGHEPISLEDTVSREFYEHEREAVFRKSWLYIGRVERVSRPGMYFTKEIEVLNASVFVTRDREQGVCVYHNVCPHRGNKLLWDTHASEEVSGRTNRFVCKFHGIGFGTDGNVEVLTDSKSWLGDQGAKLCLAKVPFEVWNGFIFVNLDHGGPQESLREFLGETFWSMFDGYPFEEMTEWFSARAIADANWKTMVDGFGETYHAGTTHILPFPPPQGMDRIDFVTPFFATHGKHRQYVSAGFDKDYYNFEYERKTKAFATGPRLPFEKDYESLLSPEAIAGRKGDWTTSSNMFFPNFYIQLYHPGWLVTYNMWPLGHDKMRFEIDMYMPPARNFSELVSHKSSISMFLEAALQDFSMLEAQQLGLSMRVFDSYPLTDEEVCVRHFHHEIQKAVDEYVKDKAAKV